MLTCSTDRVYTAGSYRGLDVGAHLFKSYVGLLALALHDSTPSRGDSGPAFAYCIICFSKLTFRN